MTRLGDLLGAAVLLFAATCVGVIVVTAAQAILSEIGGMI